MFMQKNISKEKPTIMCNKELNKEKPTIMCNKELNYSLSSHGLKPRVFSRSKFDKKELALLRKEVNAEIREIKASIKAEEKRDEFSRKVDRLYDRLEGNELLLSAIDMVISETKGQRLSDDQLQTIVKEFKDAVDFSERNGASFSSRDVLDRVLISNTNESFKSRRKRIKESRVSDSYSSRWEEALELALEQLESENYGHMNGSGEMYFRIEGRYGEEIPYEGFASFDSVNADNNLIMHVVYPESVSVLNSVERILDNPEEPEIYINDIKSEAEKEKALDQMDDYIDALKSDLKAIDDWRFSEELTEIAEAMNDHGRVEELEIELPDEDWIDFDEFDSEEEAILNAMKDAIVSELVSYSESVSRDADDVFSDASYEIEKLSDELSEFLGDARDKRRDIEQLDFDDMDESIRRRRNLRRVIESRRAKMCEKKLVEQKKTIDPHDFDMSLMSLANMAEDLDYITSNEPEVPRYVYKCLELAETIDNGISFIIKSNNNDLSKTMKDERLSDLRPTFALFLSNAEKIRKEIEHPDGDYWSRSYELRHFVEYLEEISSVLGSVL